MRILLTLWFIPLVLFWGWYALSANDIHFGFTMLTRQVHDIVFQLYGNTLGIDPAKIPGMVAAACAFDTAIVMGIAAIRWRASWYPQTKALFLSYWQDETIDDVDHGWRSDNLNFAEYSRSGQAHPAE